ncbi:ABC transporter substrate-binding protein [Reyranella sp. CPCC 100927]|uniref:ABC transporter substrate-binding protein n=1 Tax=Reyranella sp. CPCC 100927 TaxID=2599616 RepID=UPI0011B47A29|nr:ABC transporter substrate-binding protein [Reyranella sp. CPCC 100927]TWT05632.1 amino acid ABC transporter substrate-binding protein [Reyranella sp. CPCC 100927]
MQRSETTPVQRLRRRRLLGAAALGVGWGLPALVRAQAAPAFRLPLLVPLTGFIALEGKSQRDGALLALRDVGVKFVVDVIDTGSSPEGAATAWQRAFRDTTVRDGVRPPVAAMGPILGTQMLAVLPLAAEAKVPVLAISGTSRLSEMGNPWFFRFFPSDGTVKVAHAKYIAEKTGARRPAVIYQTTAYGQSGREQLARTLGELGIKPVLEEGVATTVNDFAPMIARAQAAQADALVLHLHSQSTALAVRQARTMAPSLPIIAGSAMAQPATAALLEPAELKDVCAETAAMPSAATDNDRMRKFVAAYRREYQADPDAFAVAEYDAVRMLGVMVDEIVKAKGVDAVTGDAVRARLSTMRWPGLATEYWSDGKGNMAHEALIVCYGGTDRVPAIRSKYVLPP